jgi:hypothetical protein
VVFARGKLPPIFRLVVSTSNSASLQRGCLYDTTFPTPTESPSSSESSQVPILDFSASILSSEAAIKTAIIQKLSHNTPEEVATRYFRSIQTWFPIISFTEICDRLPRTWNQTSTDLCLLFASMSLITELPQLHSSHRGGVAQELETPYLSLKSWVAILEGRGMNSLDFLNSRTLLVLFEVVHGIFPAAYISIGSLFRAADTLQNHCKDRNIDISETWRGILILDR